MRRREVSPGGCLILTIALAALALVVGLVTGFWIAAS
jgi:uncharacterized protein YneF (UPF0154 family)